MEMIRYMVDNDSVLGYALKLRIESFRVIRVDVVAILHTSTSDFPRSLIPPDTVLRGKE